MKINLPANTEIDLDRMVTTAFRDGLCVAMFDAPVTITWAGACKKAFDQGKETGAKIKTILKGDTHDRRTRDRRNT